jgi:hypothetical protein
MTEFINLGDIKICCLCGKTGRLKKVLFESSDSKLIQNYVDLFCINAYICANCLRQLKNLDTKCIQLKMRCDKVIKSIVGTSVEKKKSTKSPEIVMQRKLFNHAAISSCLRN